MQSTVMTMAALAESEGNGFLRTIFDFLATFGQHWFPDWSTARMLLYRHHLSTNLHLWGGRSCCTWAPGSETAHQLFTKLCLIKVFIITFHYDGRSNSQLRSNKFCGYGPKLLACSLRKNVPTFETSWVSRSCNGLQIYCSFVHVLHILSN